MKKSKKTILYIGNDNSAITGYVNTMHTLSTLLSTEGYKIIRSSSKQNKILRLLDMCWTTIKNRKRVDYIFIDTYSSLNFYFAFVTSQLARLFSIKYITILHGGDLPNRIKRSKKKSKMIFSNSYMNISPSDYLKKAFEEQGFKVNYIPNILELDFCEFKERKTLRPRLLWVRAFKHLYNPVMAIEVLNLLKEHYPKASLCMIGPAKDDSFDLVKEKVKQHKLEEDVEFTGVLSKEDWHKKSEEYDIFINTTNFDNTPVSVMEIMALGLPVVSTNVGGMPFLVKHNNEGILVEKENPSEMTKEICNILNEGAYEMTLNARARVESFSWNVVKKQWFEILK
ncbi:glycosyltransferase [Pseudotenacibaculum sp. MALMAid0570]|uniref:glycosyltransferase family 4 protein n=1 Tax=Pseudotenacibaculum sp. MALMAid0570 TaxID=3143938 RepID=UPI0032E0104E